MNQIITEKNYPIENRWILKMLPPFLIGIIWVWFYLFLAHFASESVTYLIIYAVMIVGQLSFAALSKYNFHYSVGDKFLDLKQGILSKQQRHIPYNVIQNILVNQDILDRIFGLASLRIENASMGAGGINSNDVKAFGIKIGQRRQSIETVGFVGNAVSIPGLSKKNAEELKGILLQKMKENPLEDSQSGL